MTDVTQAPDAAQQQAPAVPPIHIPTDLWGSISSHLGGLPWNMVRNLRNAANQVFADVGLTDANPPKPTHVPVDQNLFNTAVTFLSTRPCDEVEVLMRKIEAFVQPLQQKAAEIAAAVQGDLSAAVPVTPGAVSAATEAEVAAPAVEAAVAIPEASVDTSGQDVSVVTDVVANAAPAA